MSVINQMLRDLDARQASQQERAGLPPQLRTLPAMTVSRAHTWRVLALGMGVGALISGALVSLFMAPANTPAPVSPPKVAPALTATAPASATGARPVAEAPHPPAETGEMKISTLLTIPSGSVPSSAPSSPPHLAPAAPPKTSVVAQPPALPQVTVKSASATPAEPVKPPPTAKPVSAEAVKPAQEPVKPVEAVRSAEPAKPAPEPVKPPEPVKTNRAPPVTEAPATDAQIDKRSKGQAREMAEAEYRKGMQAVKRGDSSAAQPFLNHALELDPTLAKARQALLSVLVAGRHWSEARQTAENGLALDPTQAGWAVILARLQFEQGDAAAAIETLGRHAAHAGNDADYQGLFAYLLQKQQRPAEAAQRFQAALALRPNEGRWWFGLGLSLEAAGRADESKHAYAKAKEVGNLPADMIAVVDQKLK